MERNNLKQIQNDWLLNYKINKNGEIWSEHSKRFLKTKITNGYETISFRKKGKHITYSIHRLVALTFLPNPNEYEVVHHKNDNKLDNHVENLEWVTQKENVKRNKKKTSHPRKVQQLKNDIVIKTYDSVTEASKEIGLSRSAISKACLKVNKTAGGFVWNYLNNEHNHKELDLTKAKQIYDYENYYVFDNGCIYSKSRKKVLKPIKNASGYCYVTLSKNCIKKNYYIHVIVAEHFIRKKGNLQVNHKNKIRNDNRASNLELVTCSENMIHAHSYKGFNTKSI